jgi:hypothetical protein
LANRFATIVRTHWGFQKVMRTHSPATWLLLAPLVLSAPQAFAEVFKCTTADGKTSYSEKPCPT